MKNRIIVMLKYPRPGAVKTRLVPALGDHRACELYRALVRHTLEEVNRVAASAEIAVEARVAGSPDMASAQAWLNSAVTIRDQGDGDLGERMERAVSVAFSEGAEKVVVIGGDCPQLTAAHLTSAFAALANHEAVLGPAADGGYYLIGMRRPLPELFNGIGWGGAEVLAQTLATARSLPVRMAQLETLHDLDLPEDLPVWAATPAARIAGRGGVSVIIPALDEEARLSAALAAVRHEGPHEIIVVDGGSGDRTAEVARSHDAIVLTAPRGRARQMNHGAAVATGEFLLFLHADTTPPAGYPKLVSSTLARPAVVGGAFEFAISTDFPGRRWIERGTNWRARRRQLPYGDQGIFLRRETFGQIGGFPDLPIMEDYEFIHRLRRLGTIAIARGVALTSARRWQRLGAFRTTLINQIVVLGYHCGVRPTRLARWYHGALGREQRPLQPAAVGAGADFGLGNKPAADASNSMQPIKSAGTKR